MLKLCMARTHSLGQDRNESYSRANDPNAASVTSIRLSACEAASDFSPLPALEMSLGRIFQLAMLTSPTYTLDIRFFHRKSRTFWAQYFFLILMLYNA